MNWLIISLVAYFFLGIGNLGDKMVVSKYLSSAKVYAITVALMQSVVILLLPFFGEWPGWKYLFVDFLSGGFFVIAIYYLYKALQTGETTRVVPTIDALNPVIVFILSIVYLDQQFGQKTLVALVYLLLGGFIVAYKKGLKNRNIIKYIAISLLAFALSQVFSKVAYNHQEFLSAFIWARIGGVLAVIPFLFITKIRNELKSNFGQKNKVENSKAVAMAQGCGGAGFFLQNYAISLGSVGVVMALQGVKYVFLFAFIALLGRKFTQLKENWTKIELIQKVVGVVLIGYGLVMLID